MSRVSVAAAVALLICVGAPAIAQQSTAKGQDDGAQQSTATGQDIGGQQQSTAGSQENGTQQPPPRSRGNGALFGGVDTASKNRHRSLVLSLSVSSAYDDDLSEGLSVTALQPSVGGEFSDIGATLEFARDSPRARVAARTNSSVRHYPSLGRFVGSGYSAGTDLRLNLDRRTTFQGSVDGTYVSQYAFDAVSRQSALGNAALVASGLDVTAVDGARLTYGAAAGLTRQVGPLSVLSLHLGGRASERRMFNEFGDEKTVGGHFGRSIARKTAVGIGYTLHRSSQRLGRDTRPAWSHDVQAGIEHNWRHSTERRTVVSLSLGPSLLQLPVEGQVAGGDRIGIVASAALSHDMSRSWNLATSYRRGTGSIDGLHSDAAAADLRGLLGRRADLTISTGYSRADLGLGTGQSRYTTTFGSSRVRVALTRVVALYGEYVFYDYNVGSAMPLPAQVPLHQQRRSARAGVTLWMPLHEGR